MRKQAQWNKPQGLDGGAGNWSVPNGWRYSQDMRLSKSELFYMALPHWVPSWLSRMGKPAACDVFVRRMLGLKWGCQFPQRITIHLFTKEPSQLESARWFKYNGRLTVEHAPMRDHEETTLSEWAEAKLKKLGMAGKTFWLKIEVVR